MQLIPETTGDLAAIVAANVRSFGGGRVSDWNPITSALKDQSPQFAGGVDIKEVVEFIAPLAPLVTGERKLLERALTQLENDRDKALRKNGLRSDSREETIGLIQAFLKSHIVTLTSAA